MQTVLNETYGPFIDHDATEDQLEFPVFYANAKQGCAKLNMEEDSDNLQPLLDAIINTIPPTSAKRNASLQILATNIDHDNYVGRLAIGQILSATARSGDTIALMKGNGKMSKAKVSFLYIFEGLDRITANEASLRRDYCPCRD